MHPNYIDKFLDSLWLENGLSENTLSSYRLDLESFYKWFEAECHSSESVISRAHILEYLSHRLTKGIKASSTARTLSCLRRYFRFLLREKMISEDPTLNIDNPRLPKILPSSLSEEEVESLLSAPEENDPIGLRDRTMLEIMYGSGLRVSELVEIGRASCRERVYAPV